MRGYTQFSFWILIALAKICFFHIDINRAKILLYLWANFLMSRDVQNVCMHGMRSNKGGTVLNSGAVMFLRSETQKPSKIVRNTLSGNPKNLRTYLLGLRHRKDIIQTIFYSCQHN